MTSTGHLVSTCLQLMAFIAPFVAISLLKAPTLLAVSGFSLQDFNTLLKYEQLPPFLFFEALLVLLTIHFTNAIQPERMRNGKAKSAKIKMSFGILLVRIVQMFAFCLPAATLMLLHQHGNDIHAVYNSMPHWLHTDAPQWIYKESILPYSKYSKLFSFGGIKKDDAQLEEAFESKIETRALEWGVPFEDKCTQMDDLICTTIPVLTPQELEQEVEISKQIVVDDEIKFKRDLIHEKEENNNVQMMNVTEDSSSTDGGGGGISDSSSTTTTSTTIPVADGQLTLVPGSRLSFCAWSMYPDKIWDKPKGHVDELKKGHCYPMVMTLSTDGLLEVSVSTEDFSKGEKGEDSNVVPLWGRISKSETAKTPKVAVSFTGNNNNNNNISDNNQLDMVMVVSKVETKGGALKKWKTAYVKKLLS
eukprot:gene10950-22872_t